VNGTTVSRDKGEAGSPWRNLLRFPRSGLEQEGVGFLKIFQAELVGFAEYRVLREREGSRMSQVLA
jgi:hypothetical protein